MVISWSFQVIDFFSEVQMDALLPDYVQWLMDKENYPHQVESVELIQTHISYIVLAGAYVYKFKKPVDFGFLDFTSLEKRKYFCNEELRLNRRLCPNVYLRTVELGKCCDDFCWGEGDEPIEYAVQMRRLKEDRMMGRLIARGQLQKADIVRIADVLIPFYERAGRSDRVKQFGDVRVVSRTIQENFMETRQFVGGVALPENRFKKIQRIALRFLGKEQIFAQRVRLNKICECHGDLHSGNICLEQEVAIFDCIEFNERLRCTDIAADLAFMAMDLDYHSLHDYSDLFINSYLERSEDEKLMDVLAFYMCYRAYVRGKIGLLTSADSHVSAETRKNAEESAKKYFMLAEEYGEQIECR